MARSLYTNIASRGSHLEIIYDEVIPASVAYLVSALMLGRGISCSSGGMAPTSGSGCGCRGPWRTGIFGTNPGAWRPVSAGHGSRYPGFLEGLLDRGGASASSWASYTRFSSTGGSTAPAFLEGGWLDRLPPGGALPPSAAIFKSWPATPTWAGPRVRPAAPTCRNPEGGS